MTFEPRSLWLAWLHEDSRDSKSAQRATSGSPSRARQMETLPRIPPGGAGTLRSRAFVQESAQKEPKRV